MVQAELLAKQLTDYLYFMEVTFNITTNEQFKVDYKKTNTAHRWTLTRQSIINHYGYNGYDLLGSTMREYIFSKVTLAVIDDPQFVLKIIHDRGVKPKDCRDPKSVFETLEKYISEIYI